MKTLEDLFDISKLVLFIAFCVALAVVLLVGVVMFLGQVVHSF